MDRWLSAALAYIPRWLDFQMRASEQPGCSLAIAHRGDVVLEHAFGHADLRAGEALTPRHRFRVASHSKSFTAAGMHEAARAGALKLEDPRGPVRDRPAPGVARATIAQLLSHSAGIFRDGTDGGYFVDRAPFLDDASCCARPESAAGDRAGHALKYSNHGFAPRRPASSRQSPASLGATGSRARSSTPPASRRPRPTCRSPPACRSRAAIAAALLLGRRLVIPGDHSTRRLRAGHRLRHHRRRPRALLRPALAEARSEHVWSSPAGAR